MKLYLMRHGETALNKQRLIQGAKTNSKLNKEGIEQIKTTGECLSKKQISFDIIGASLLSRAIESADIIANCINYQKNILLFPNFHERDFGDLEGKPLDLFYETLNKEHNFKFESIDELKKRIKKAIGLLYDKFHNHTVLIVCHSQVIKAAMMVAGCDILITSVIKNGEIKEFLVTANEIIPKQ